MHSRVAISANQIGRTYRVQKKHPGLKGSIKALLNPEYETKAALSDVSLEIKTGEFVGLIGSNGAGKTTLLKILSGLIPASSGSARVLDTNPFDRKIEFRKQISLVMGQKSQLWWDLPAQDGFDLLQAIYDIPDAVFKSRVTELTALLQVESLLATQIRRLSLGERMKMEIIAALLHDPKMIFLDEPTIGLDLIAAARLRDFLKTYQMKNQATIILTSHNMHDIGKLCERVIILKGGKIFFDGAPSKLTDDVHRVLKVRLLQTPTSEEMSAAISKPAIYDDVDQTFSITCEKDQIPRVLESVMNRYRLVDMSLEEPSLESAMQKIL